MWLAMSATGHATVALGVALLLSPGSLARAQDTLVVRADNPPSWGLNLRTVEEVRIGALEGPEEYVFGRVQSIAVGLDGTIYVTDDQVPVIRCYDSDGSYLGDVGREGSGPGEYMRIRGTLSANVGETRSSQRIRVGRR